MTPPVEREIVPGYWYYGRGTEVIAVECDCGKSIYANGYLHARLVNVRDVLALCARCKKMVRVPVRLAA